MERYSYLVRKRGKHLSLFEKVKAGLAKVEAEIVAEIDKCRSVIGINEQLIEATKKSITEEYQAIEYLSNEKSRTSVLGSKVGELTES